MSVALTRSPPLDLDAARQAARDGGRQLRRDPRDDLALDRRRAGHGGLRPPCAPGLDAVNQIERINPDVAVLDIEMPELDGISALPQLLAKKRDLVIIMASTLTRRNAEISFKALSLGASDYIPKPESTREATAAETFHHDLIEKIRHLGAKVRRTGPASASAPQARHRRRRLSRHARVGYPSGSRRRLRRPQLARRPLQHAGAARASDRLVDRRSAGPDDAGRRHRLRDRSFSGADHAAHAADLHHDSRRASGARKPTAGA